VDGIVKPGARGRAGIDPVAGRAVRELYGTVLDRWNQREVEAKAQLFAEDSIFIGYGGSTIKGRSEIASDLRRIFEDHQTAVYFGIVRKVKLLRGDVALLWAVASDSISEYARRLPWSSGAGWRADPRVAGDPEGLAGRPRAKRARPLRRGKVWKQISV
jgi:uncharacterized protein (TIGR02246 family)